MKRLTAILMLVGLALVSTPHLLCPWTCGHGQEAASPAKCPHCRTNLPVPDPAPSDDSDCPCCKGIDAVVADVSPLPAPPPMTSNFIVGDGLAILPIRATVASDVFWALNFSPGLQRPGCALIILLSQLLL